jgi:hypothetical protein
MPTVLLYFAQKRFYGSKTTKVDEKIEITHEIDKISLIHPLHQKLVLRKVNLKFTNGDISMQIDKTKMEISLEKDGQIIETGYFNLKRNIGCLILTSYPETKCSKEKCASYVENQKKIYYCNFCCSKDDRRGCCYNCWRGKKRPCVIVAEVSPGVYKVVKVTSKIRENMGYYWNQTMLNGASFNIKAGQIYQKK